jgi:hypothetical protein
VCYDLKGFSQFVSTNLCLSFFLCRAVDGFCNISANSAFGSNVDHSPLESVVNVVGNCSTSAAVTDPKEMLDSEGCTQVNQEVP